ncbi:MAG: PAS domain S-box protein [Mangrovibacterium sp.]
MNQYSGLHRTIIQSSNDSFVEIDREGMICCANEVFCALSGYSKSELAALRFFDLECSGSDMPGGKLLLQAKQLGNLSLRTTFRKKNGRLFQVEVHLNYLSGQSDLFVAVLRQIGETNPNGLNPDNCANTAIHKSNPFQIIEQHQLCELANKTSLHLLDFSKNQPIEKILQEYLRQIENLTDSQLSYWCRYQQSNQQVSTCNWSAKAKNSINQHQLDEKKLIASCFPDVVQCFERRHASISNKDNRATAPNGQPENFSHMVVPIMVDQQVNTLVGLIKTNGEFHPGDLEIVQFITKLTHEVISRKQSEEKAIKLETATDNSQVSIIVTNTAGLIEYANPYFSELTGYQQAEYIGKNPKILQTGHHPRTHYQQLWETILDGNTWEGEFYNRKKDGTHYWEKASISPIKNEQGEIVNFVAVKADITETKTMTQALIKAKEEAEESRRWFEAIFYTSPVPFSITKLTGEYVDVNDQFLSVSGYAKDELIGRKAMDIGFWVNPEDRKNFIQTLIDNGQIDHFESNFRMKNNDIRYMAISGKLLQIGKEPLVLLASKDITLQKETEAALIETKEKAEESDRLKTTFLQNISHEIRTPMNAIVGFSELLGTVTNKPETMQQYIRIINQRCEDLLVIIDSIMDISRIECGELPIYPERFNLKMLYDELLELTVEKQRHLNRLHISAKVSVPIANHFITTDKRKLKQIFINLISNALKYTNKGSVTFGHRFDSTGQVQFFVADTGIGIHQSDFDKLFIRFKQLNQSTSEHLGGNGLGLAISKGLANALGGHIGVQSEIGIGTTFFFNVKDTTANETDNRPVAL